MTKTSTSSLKTTKPIKPTPAKFPQPNLPKFSGIKPDSNFRPTGRFQTINRSRR
ncbi:MAG TPA: hypothetical protein PKZ92_03700 [Candidatus Woesebacteria bacterium]|nr:hypothetical protein [Candidatus Shapirobacteria bacterium]HOR02332.1 hypothetical protein [Candidatus Woesebacteria bacterium]